MRSIGKRNKTKLLNIIITEINLQQNNIFGRSRYIYGGGIDYNRLELNIKCKVPVEWYEIWEGAYTEIENLIDSALTNYSHTKVIEF